MRSPGAMADWHRFYARWRSPRTDVWSRYPVELAPDLIICPHLFDWPASAPRNGEVYTCAGTPEVVVLCGRGPDHIRFLEEEVVPRVVRHGPSVCLVEAEADQFRWVEGPSREQGPAQPLTELGPALRSRWDDPALVHAEFGPAPWHRDAAPTEDALRDLEDHPIRLWEALFWRGYTYRWELIGGEVPLVGALGTEAAARATLTQIAADASRLVGDPAVADGGWTRCGPFRLRTLGTRVDLRVRLSPADRRAAFLPQVDRDERRMPSILGVLLAGGDNGKSELMDGWSWATVILSSSDEARALAEALVPAVSAWTGAPVHVADQRPTRATAPEAWVIEPYERFLRVSVPFLRQQCLPWRVMVGELEG
jgi:hypothetical protein